MGFNRRKLEADRKGKAQAEAARRRATDAQVREDAERLIATWNERQAKRSPCCSHLRSVLLLPVAIGSCGSAARPIERQALSACAPLTATAMPP